MRQLFKAHMVVYSVRGTGDYIPVRKRATTVTKSREEFGEPQGLMSDLVEAYSKEIYKNNILTPGKSKDKNAASLCIGDSGGPVLFKGNLVGINTNYTFNDFNKEGYSLSGISFYNMHSRVSRVRTWLSKIMSSSR
ncbi:MAG TPA: trypsin-like serine protease [Bacteriovoracaceae bacterium]|nr:trypsin-like serine protease [Bacteriovoracaceae bacterium]